MSREKALVKVTETALASTKRHRRLVLSLWKGFDETKGAAVALISNPARFGINGVGIAGSSNTSYHGNINGLALAGISNSAGQDLNGVAVAGLINQAETANGLIAAPLNVCSRIQGAMVGLINIVRCDSAGVQVGLLNIRMDAPWYAKVIPGLAIRIPQRHRVRKGKTCNSVNDDNPGMLASRQENRIKLAQRYAERNGLLKENGVYRSPDPDAVVRNLCRDVLLLKAFAFEQGIASRKRIKELFRIVRTGSNEEQKEATETLACIVSDCEVYGAKAGRHAMKVLVSLSRWPKRVEKVKDEIAGEYVYDGHEMSGIGTYTEPAVRYEERHTVVEKHVFRGNQFAKEALLSLGRRDRYLSDEPF